MAGGVSVPAARRCGLRGGRAGFLAAGYKTADGMYQEIKQLRGPTNRPLRRQPLHAAARDGRPRRRRRPRHQLAGEAAWYETELGDPECGRDDGYDTKIAVLLDNPVPVVSFHFGVPQP
ncbi:nitronate monooxygenase [Streptomyces thinghirensis]|nr:nitronate monooxygenase [Streptomyces thinghirensis]